MQKREFLLELKFILLYNSVKNKIYEFLLRYNYGIHQQILRWLIHYLCSGTQYVCVNGSSSNILATCVIWSAYWPVRTVDGV